MISVLGVVLKVSEVKQAVVIVVVVDVITEADQTVLVHECLIVLRQESLVRRALHKKIGRPGIRV